MNRPDWRCLSTTYPYQSRVFRIRQDRVDLGNGVQRDLSYVDSEGAVYVVPVTREGEVVLIEQYRHPVGRWVWEVPAGAMFDHTGSLAQLAERELLEEVGGVAVRMQGVGWFYDAAPISNSKCHVFLAHGVSFEQAPRRGATELIRRHVVGVDRALSMARDAAMVDGRSALALLRCERLLSR